MVRKSSARVDNEYELRVRLKKDIYIYIRIYTLVRTFIKFNPSLSVIYTRMHTYAQFTEIIH